MHTPIHLHISFITVCPDGWFATKRKCLKMLTIRNKFISRYSELTDRCSKLNSKIALMSVVDVSEFEAYLSVWRHRQRDGSIMMMVDLDNVTTSQSDHNQMCIVLKVMLTHNCLIP